MMNKVVNSKKVFEDLLNRMMIGAGFSGFYFSSEFTLYFERESIAKFEEMELPNYFEMNVLGECWFGDSQSWSKEVQCRGAGIEPSEPVLAFELAKLRWMEGANIKSLSFEQEALKIVFDNDVEFVLAYTTSDEYAFSVKERGRHECDAKLIVTCENENFFVSTK